MQFIYNISIALYGLLIRFASLFNTKAKLWVIGRRDWESKLVEFKKNNPKKLVWIHAASLGEFEQGRPIIEEINKRYPQYGIVLSFFSPSGYEVRKNYDQVDYVCYMPLDSMSNARKFIGIMEPTIAIIVKYEFWLNHLSILSQKKIPHFLVSGIFRESQVFFKPYGSIFRKSLAGFNHLFVQNENSLDLLSFIQANHKSISGDTRFDRVFEIKENDNEIVDIQQFKGDDLLVVVGSSWPTEEQYLLKFIESNQDCKYLIAPHNINQSSIDQFILDCPISAQKYSTFKESADKNTPIVLIIDSIGLLSQIYKYADITVIGGGFNAGIHNVLESAVWGQPILFGPKYQNFKEAKDLLNLGGAASFNNQESFNENLTSLLSDGKLRSKKSSICKEYCLENKGATQLVMDSLVNFLID